MASYAREVRSRYRGRQREKYRKRVEADLDKVNELASKEEDCKAIHFFYWPEQLRRLWFEAAVQLIDREVNWDVRFPQYGATVRLRGNEMDVQWEDFGVDGSPHIGLGGTGISGVPNNENWNLASLKERERTPASGSLAPRS